MNGSCTSTTLSILCTFTYPVAFPGWPMYLVCKLQTNLWDPGANLNFHNIIQQFTSSILFIGVSIIGNFGVGTASITETKEYYYYVSENEDNSLKIS